MNKSEKAVQIFNNGFNCSQAVCSVFCNEFGVSEEIALKVACGFGGGMRQGEVCGAVTGAIMALGLKYGQSKTEDKDAKEKTYKLVREFGNMYKALNGSIICKELLGYDISKEDEYRQASEKGLFSSFCPKLIKDAVELLEVII